MEVFTMAQLFMRYPGGLAKALTFSYDDGVEQDIRFIEILDKHGMKGTFNINSGSYPSEDKVWPEGTVHRRMPYSRCTEIYSKGGHEVAVHALTHAFLEQLPKERVAYEIVKDRENLENQFGCIVRGMAYPYGTFSDDVVNVLDACGILYARTTQVTRKFDIPQDWLRLPATCHHNEPTLMELAKKFAEMKVAAKSAPKLFYVWGHTYEFEGKDNWNVIEEFCDYMGGRDDIWYATNIEIFEYIKDFERLEYSVDGKIVKNPTAREIFYQYNGEISSIKPGETKRV